MSDFLQEYIELQDLWGAACRGDLKAIRAYVADGADINAKREDLYTMVTPIHCAAHFKQAEAIRELVSLGAKINEKDDENNTPLLYAIAAGANIELIDLLLDLGANMNMGSQPALSAAAGIGDEKMVRFLLSRGAKPRKQDTTLWAASASGNIAVVRFLLEAGANVNPTRPMTSALDVAAIEGYMEMIRVLLDAGANPNNRDNVGYTPLMSAVVGKKGRAVRMVLQAGADVNSIAYDGRTALDLAERDGSTEIIGMLKEFGGKRGDELTQSKQELGKTT